MIEVKNSSIIIRNKSSNSDAKSYFKLNKTFSIYNDVTHSYEMSILTEIGDDIYMPATINLDLIKNIYQLKRVAFNDRSINPDTISIHMRNRPRNNQQIDVVNFLTGIQNSDFRHRMVIANTGLGKTFCTINAIANLGVKALIVVDKNVLAEQWKNQFIEHSDLTEDDIFLISGSKSLVEIKKTNFKVAIAMHQTLTQALKNNKNILNEVIIETGIGIRVFDEVHKSFLSTCNNLSLCNVLYNFYLTATPDRSSWKESKLWHAVFDSVETFVAKEQEAHVNTLMLRYNTSPTEGNIRACSTKYGFSTQRYANYIVSYRFNAFYSSLKKVLDTFKIISSGKKTAIIIPSIEWINATKTALSEDYDAEIATCTSEQKKSERLEALQKQVFIATEAMLGTGVDISDLEVVINYSPFSSKVNATQLLGRLRNNAGYTHTLYDVTDYGFESCIKHSYTRKSVYKAKSATLTNVTTYL